MASCSLNYHNAVCPDCADITFTQYVSLHISGGKKKSVDKDKYVSTTRYAFGPFLDVRHT